jgi:uncharacterized protein
MDENSLREGQLDTIKEFLLKKVEPYLIILFGSAAQGKLRTDSDIDLAFLCDRTFNEYDIFLSARELSDILGRDVDLIDLSQASTVLKAQVIGKGKVVFNGDTLRGKVFAMNTFKEYAVLNEERQCVLDRFKERGLNYAK